MNNTMKYLYGLLTLVASVSSFSLFAASLQVTPVNLFFEKNENAKAVYLSNSGPHDVRAQLRLYLWEQENGKD
ncbi:fimbrial biogenesis chaperone, partial [Escherichia coli]